MFIVEKALLLELKYDGKVPVLGGRHGTSWYLVGVLLVVREERCLQVDVSYSAILSSHWSESTSSCASATIRPVDLSSRRRGTIEISSCQIASTGYKWWGESPMNYPRFKTFCITIHKIEMISSNDPTVPLTHLRYDLVLN